jgi:DNA-binding MarR family transcriptional regulator
MYGAQPEIGMRLHDLLKVIRRMKQSRSATQPGIPTGLLGLLAEIDRLPTGCRSRDLAAQADLDPSTVSRAVGALVAHGLVTREADPHDGRSTFLVVTAAGRAALLDAFQWYGQVLASALDGWSDAEISTFHAGLDRFATGVHDALTSHEVISTSHETSEAAL